MVGADRRLVGVVEQHARLIGRGVLADRLHGQLRDALLDLRAAHFQDRDLGSRRAAQRHGRQRPQLAHLQRLHLQVDVGDLLGERRIVADRAQHARRRAWTPAPRRCPAARWRAGTWRRSSPRSPCRSGWRPGPSHCRGTRRSRAWAPSSMMIGRTVTPGVFMSISRKEMPSCGLASVSVRTRQKIQSPQWA